MNDKDKVDTLIKSTFKRMLDDPKIMREMSVMITIPGKLSEEQLKVLNNFSRRVESNGEWKRDVEWFDAINELFHSDDEHRQILIDKWCEISGREWVE